MLSRETLTLFPVTLRCPDSQRPILSSLSNQRDGGRDQDYPSPSVSNLKSFEKRILEIPVIWEDAVDAVEPSAFDLALLQV